MIYEKQVANKAVLVTSDADISVFGYYTAFDIADAMACLPVEDLGTEYYIFTSGGGHANQFAVANGRDTVVWINITVSGSVEFNGVLYGDQDTFSVSLKYQQIIQLQSTQDLSGTRVISTAPVAVFSGNKCFTGINTYCDVLIEQLYPVQNWGRSFATFPLLQHTQDIIDVMAAYPNTTVTIESANETIKYNLQRGAHVRHTLAGGSLVNSSKPIMISYLVQESRLWLGTAYDPFFITVPPLSLTRNYYKFVTQDTYYNYLLIVSLAPSASEFYLDHRPINLYDLSVTELNGVKGWEVSLGKIGGQHEIYHNSFAFSIFVYGVERYLSYGYSMGQESKYPAPPSPPEEPDISQELSCLSDSAVYHLPLSSVSDAGLSLGDIHLVDPLCGATRDGNFARIKVPFNRCGSTVAQGEDRKTFYLNTVYGTIPGTDIHRIEVQVRCEMEENETLGLSFYPQATDEVSRGRYNVSLRLYRDGNFHDPITAFPYEIDLDGRLYVEFKVESADEDLQILAENCRASPSLFNTEETYSIIQHGCAQDSTMKPHPVSDHRKERFSFHVLKFEDSQAVYLACDVVICHNSTLPNRCAQGCLSRRARRDAASTKTRLDTANLSQGPIVFKQGHPIQRAEGRSGNEDHYTFPSSMFIAALCLVGSLAAVLLIVQRYHYKVQGYSALKNSHH
ncbi:uncharacterized protein RCH25_007109 [Pelodytes ibericus]